MSSSNILCIDQYSNLGGGQRSLLDLLPGFRERGWVPHLAVPKDGPLTDAAQRDGYPVFYLGGGAAYTQLKKSGGEMLKYAAEQPHLIALLARLVRAARIKLMYVNGPRVITAAAVVSRLAGIPLIFHCHNRLLQRSAVLLAGSALQLAQGNMIACCRFAAEPLMRYLDQHRLKIVFNGVSDMSAEPLRPAGHIRRIGVIGRIEEHKGQLEFVRAARVVAARFPNCRFRIIGVPMFSGTGYSDLVVRESRDLSVEFHGWKDDVRGILADLDLLIVPSKSVEATTRVILEAFSARVPVIAFPSGGILEVLQDEATGFLTPASTAEALATRIEEVLEKSPVDLQAITAQARLAWEKNFTLAGYRKQVCEVVDRTLRA